MTPPAHLDTPRLRLQPWTEDLRDTFAALNADPEVMADLGGPLPRPVSDAKFDRFRSAHDQSGFSRWAILDREDRFVGYAGVLPGEEGPLGPHHDIGWRLIRSAWGQGFAAEAARAALDDVFGRVGLSEVLAYTAADNFRSRSVMAKLNLQRQAHRDFTALYSGKPWSGLVWAAHPHEPGDTAHSFP